MMNNLIKNFSGSIPLVCGLLLADIAGAQNSLKFTATRATEEKAIQLEWQSNSNGVYQILYTKSLSENIVWDTLVDMFPSQGSNTLFLDTGKYWTEPALPFPKDDPQRFYRIVQVGTNTLVPPIVTITNLTSGTNLSGEVEIGIHVATTDGITFVRYFVDGEQVQLGTADEDGNSSYAINTTEWPNGTHVIFAVAETTSGAESTGSPSSVQNGAGTSSSIPVTFNNWISKWNFSLPGFDSSLGETQRITAEFAGYSCWTLQIVDEFFTVVRNTTGEGTSMSFDWDGNDNNGLPTSDGTYDYILSATQCTPPLGFSANSNSELSISKGLPQWLAAPADGSGPVLPLALFPPGIPTNNLTIFQGILLDYQERPNITRTEKTTVSSGLVNAVFAEAASAPQTTQRPRRPQPKSIKGTPGKFGVAWQGDHPDPGTTGIAGFNRPQNLSGSIQLDPNFLLPYGPIKNAGNIASGFETTMGNYKWKKAFNYGDDNLTAELLRKPSKGGSNLFNYCNIGLLIGHGIRGNNQDARATSTPSLQTYMPIYKKGVNAYNWVRMSEFDFGGGPVGLRWMGIYACNMLSRLNALDMYDKGVLPMNPNLHILLAEETSIFMYPSFGQKWASYMNGGEGGGRRTIIDSWILASQLVHKVPGVVPAGHTVAMTCAYWPACQNDRLLSYTNNDTNDPSEILFRRVQVFPNYQEL